MICKQDATRFLDRVEQGLVQHVAAARNNNVSLFLWRGKTERYFGHGERENDSIGSFDTIIIGLADGEDRVRPKVHVMEVWVDPIADATRVDFHDLEGDKEWTIPLAGAKSAILGVTEVAQGLPYLFS